MPKLGSPSKYTEKTSVYHESERKSTDVEIARSKSKRRSKEKTKKVDSLICLWSHDDVDKKNKTSDDVIPTKGATNKKRLKAVKLKSKSEQDENYTKIDAGTEANVDKLFKRDKHEKGHRLKHNLQETVSLHDKPERETKTKSRQDRGRETKHNKEHKWREQKEDHRSERAHKNNKIEDISDVTVKVVPKRSKHSKSTRNKEARKSDHRHDEDLSKKRDGNKNTNDTIRTTKYNTKSSYDGATKKVDSKLVLFYKNEAMLKSDSSSKQTDFSDEKFGKTPQAQYQIPKAHRVICKCFVDKSSELRVTNSHQNPSDDRLIDVQIIGSESTKQNPSGTSTKENIPKTSDINVPVISSFGQQQRLKKHSPKRFISIPKCDLDYKIDMCLANFPKPCTKSYDYPSISDVSGLNADNTAFDLNLHEVPIKTDNNQIVQRYVDSNGDLVQPNAYYQSCKHLIMQNPQYEPLKSLYENKYGKFAMPKNQLEIVQEEIKKIVDEALIKSNTKLNYCDLVSNSQYDWDSDDDINYADSVTENLPKPNDLARNFFGSALFGSKNFTLPKSDLKRKSNQEIMVPNKKFKENCPIFRLLEDALDEYQKSGSALECYGIKEQPDDLEVVWVRQIIMVLSHMQTLLEEFFRATFTQSHICCDNTKFGCDKFSQTSLYKPKTEYTVQTYTLFCSSTSFAENDNQIERKSSLYNKIKYRLKPKHKKTRLPRSNWVGAIAYSHTKSYQTESETQTEPKRPKTHRFFKKFRIAVKSLKRKYSHTKTPDVESKDNETHTKDTTSSMGLFKTNQNTQTYYGFDESDPEENLMIFEHTKSGQAKNSANDLATQPNDDYTKNSGPFRINQNTQTYNGFNETDSENLMIFEHTKSGQPKNSANDLAPQPNDYTKPTGSFKINQNTQNYNGFDETDSENLVIFENTKSGQDVPLPHPKHDLAPQPSDDETPRYHVFRSKLRPLSSETSQLKVTAIEYINDKTLPNPSDPKDDPKPVLRKIDTDEIVVKGHKKVPKKSKLPKPVKGDQIDLIDEERLGSEFEEEEDALDNLLQKINDMDKNYYKIQVPYQIGSTVDEKVGSIEHTMDNVDDPKGFDSAVLKRRNCECKSIGTTAGVDVKCFGTQCAKYSTEEKKTQTRQNKKLHDRCVQVNCGRPKCIYIKSRHRKVHKGDVAASYYTQKRPIPNLVYKDLLAGLELTEHAPLLTLNLDQNKDFDVETTRAHTKTPFMNLLTVPSAKPNRTLTTAGFLVDYHSRNTLVDSQMLSTNVFTATMPERQFTPFTAPNCSITSVPNTKPHQTHSDYYIVYMPETNESTRALNQNSCADFKIWYYFQNMVPKSKIYYPIGSSSAKSASTLPNSSTSDCSSSSVFKKIVLMKKHTDEAIPRYQKGVVGAADVKSSPTSSLDMSNSSIRHWLGQFFNRDGNCEGSATTTFKTDDVINQNGGKAGSGKNAIGRDAEKRVVDVRYVAMPMIFNEERSRGNKPKPMPVFCNDNSASQNCF